MFLWLLPGANDHVASSIAERLRRITERDLRSGDPPLVAISVGYALWKHGDDLESLLSRVEGAMHEAKVQG